ncbi:hypothetical protein JOM49_008244 [Amycolatopsis magusensis]|uniref:Transposase n=1 Tax=Amycolatopsis magusensis TaxID=882444 RepID=A0ABS4Q543_9PSEU|nr:hypothetical protein [Amycolatopsis magusensis]
MVAGPPKPGHQRKTGGIFARLLEQYEHTRTWHLSARA